MNYQKYKLVDAHEGGWHDGLEVALVLVSHPKKGTLLSCVRNGPSMGLFSNTSGPLMRTYRDRKSVV